MRSWFKRSGHATVIAYLALFLAVGGGAFAIAKGGKINGSKLKKRSVAGKKLKKNTITGTEVNENKLGKVPSAKAADTATTATTAGTAGTANVANSVTTLSPTSLVKTTSSASAAGKAAAAAAAAQVTLYEDSHFRLYGKCFIDEGGPQLYGVVYIATKQDGAIFDAEEDELSGEPSDGYLNVGTEEELREVVYESTSEDSASIEESQDFGATAADGYSILGSNQVAVKFGTLATGNGPYGPGNVCLFTTMVVHS
jgi:hypothetical protein